MIGFGIAWIDWIIWTIGLLVLVVDTLVIAYFVLMRPYRHRAMRRLIAEHDAMVESE